MLYSTVLRIASLLAKVLWELQAIRREQTAQGEQIAAILAQVSPNPATHVEIELGTPQPQ